MTVHLFEWILKKFSFRIWFIVVISSEPMVSATA